MYISLTRWYKILNPNDPLLWMALSCIIRHFRFILQPSSKSHLLKFIHISVDVPKKKISIASIWNEQKMISVKILFHQNVYFCWKLKNNKRSVFSRSISKCQQTKGKKKENQLIKCCFYIKTYKTHHHHHQKKKRLQNKPRQFIDKKMTTCHSWFSTT